MDKRTERTPEKRRWVENWLRMFRETGNVSISCQAAGISRTEVYDYRKESPEFAAAWADAEEDAIEALEEVARERAKASSDTLLIFLLKAHRPEKYREQFTILLKRFQDMTDDQVNDYLAQRLIQAPASGADSAGDAAVAVGAPVFDD